MLLTLKEMEALCVFHSGTLAETLATLRFAAGGNQSQPRMDEIKSLVEKLSGLKDGDVVSIAFDRE